jgi:CHAT domain-containing protein
LKDDETYISFYLLKHYSVAFVINRWNWEAVKLHLGQNKIEEKIIDMREFIRRTPVAKRKFIFGSIRKFSDFYSDPTRRYIDESMEVFKELFTPLLPYCKTKKIVVSADGVLYGFPLEALITKIPEYYKDDRGNRYKLDKMLIRLYSKKIPLFYEYSQVEYLADKFIISYIPSGSCFNFLRKKSKPKGSKRNSVIVFANPRYSNNPLEKDEEKKKRNLYIENQSIKKWPHEDLGGSFDAAVAFTREIGNAKFYAGCEAKEEMYSSSNIKDAKYILFSTWCVLGRKAEQTDRSEPALVLALVDNPEEYDGLLGMTEVAGLKLKCDIVIFSASNSTCETETGGEGFAGMTKSFLFSGSQAVVASHWQVDPSIAKKWLEIFGENLKTKAKLAALHETKKRIKESIEYEGNDGVKVSYAHPYYWASFVLFGENEYEK